MGNEEYCVVGDSRFVLDRDHFDRAHNALILKLKFKDLKPWAYSNCFQDSYMVISYSISKLDITTYKYNIYPKIRVIPTGSLFIRYRFDHY